MALVIQRCALKPISALGRASLLVGRFATCAGNHGVRVGQEGVEGAAVGGGAAIGPLAISPVADWARAAGEAAVIVEARHAWVASAVVALVDVLAVVERRLVPTRAAG